MARSFSFLRRAGLAVLIGLGVAAAADAQPSLDARLDRLTDGVDLTAEQTASLDALAARYADADRADLWAAAAEVSTVLTDAQIDQLQQARAERRTERGARGGRRGSDGRRGRRGDRPGREARADLTDEQRDALRAIRADVREQAEDLADQLRQGTISDEAFLDQTRALRAEGVRRSAEVLPAEAAARLAERRAQRDAAKAAREQVLGLTGAQKQQLQARRLDRIRTAPERLDMRPFLDDDGRLDREAYRAARRAQREAARDERPAVLTDEQQDIAFLYRALADGPRGRRRGGRRGR